MNLKVNLTNMEIDNPIIPASGTFGYGYEFNQFYDINVLGTFSSKAITIEKRQGNALPRISEVSGGLLNAIGLQNPGVKDIINKEFVKLKEVYNKQIIANISGACIEDYVLVAKQLDKEDIVSILELNVSCPNVKKGAMAFGKDKEVLKQLIKEIKQVSKKPLYVKLTPNVDDITEFAIVCEKAGADGLVLINTLQGMDIDIYKHKPILANVTGGLSGDCIFPVALNAVYQTYKKVSIPIIGVGGISSVDDVIKMLLAGATAVQIGSANLKNPFICKEIIAELPKRLKELGYENINEVIGGAHGK